MIDETRRGFFRLLSAIASVPSSRAVAKLLPGIDIPKPAEAKVVCAATIVREPDQDLIRMSLVRCGLIMCNEIPAKSDIDYCTHMLTHMRNSGEISNHLYEAHRQLARAIAPAYGVPERIRYLL